MSKLQVKIDGEWEAQALTGYPCAEENVKYFEDMVRKESGNAET